MRSKKPVVVIQELKLPGAGEIIGVVVQAVGASNFRIRCADNFEKRYVQLARKISAHYRIRIPQGLKNRICKNCNNLLAPGINCKVRVASGNKYIVYSCECGHEKHIFYKRSRKA